jgi:hypothetical protein
LSEWAANSFCSEETLAFSWYQIHSSLKIMMLSGLETQRNPAIGFPCIHQKFVGDFEQAVFMLEM